MREERDEDKRSTRGGKGRELKKRKGLDERGGDEGGSVWKGRGGRWGEKRVDMGRKGGGECKYLTLTSEAPTSSRAFAKRISFTSTSAIYTT